MSDKRIASCILAAGKGTRLKTQRPKVLHEICGRPMLAYVLDACRAAGVSHNVVVVGYEKQQILDAFGDQPDVSFVEQAEQLGTGHAVMVCREALLDRFDQVAILCGDGPLIRARTIAALLGQHRESAAACTLATAELDDPTGYGRIIRDGDGSLLGIVEEKDCTLAQKAIREVNPSYYCFNTTDLFAALDKTDNNNAKGEYYLTDTLGVLVAAGRQVGAITAVPPEDILGINSRNDLAYVSAVLRDRTNGELMENGVTILDPSSTWIDPRAEIGQDTVIHPFSCIGAARIGRNCQIGPFAHLADGTTLADGTRTEARG